MTASPARPYLIQRQALHIQVCGAESDGLAVQRMAAELCRGELLRAVERALQQRDPVEGHLVIERLDIDAGALALDQLERELPGRVAAALDRALAGLAMPAEATGESARSGGADGVAGSDVGREGVGRKNAGREDTRPGRPQAAPPDAGLRQDRGGRPAAPSGAVLAGGDAGAPAASGDEHGRAGDGVGAGPAGRAGAQHLNDAQATAQALAHFLASGSLPWSYPLPAGMTLEQAVRAAWHAAGDSGAAGPGELRLVLPVLADARARRRLAVQFTPGFLSALLARLSPQAGRAAAGVMSGLQNIPAGARERAELERLAWEAAFGAASAEEAVTAPGLARAAWEALALSPEQRAVLEPVMRRLWPETFPEGIGPTPAGPMPAPAAPGRPAAPAPARPADSGRGSRPAVRLDSPLVDTESGVYLNLAGLVLLHPFLSRFFAALGIAVDDRLVQPDRALHLLYYLATGRAGAPEYELLLPKVLCGQPLDAPVDGRIELTGAELDEAAALLRAVIGHWEALRDTSPDGLRGSFLARPGKLSERDGAWLLQVEASGYDILLDQLPWSLSMVQLPWMARWMWVEWR